MVVSIVLLIMGVNYLKGINLFERQRDYFAVYDQIDGLTVGNPVIMNGFKIGMVKDIDLHPDSAGVLVVRFLINKKNLDIPVDTRAKIYSSDFFGSKAIELEIGESIVMAPPGTELESSRQEDITTALRKELEPLKARTEDLIADIDVIITNMKSVFEDEATQGLPDAFESLSRTLKNFEMTSLKLDQAVSENTERFSSIMKSVTSISGNLEANNEKISSVITNFNAISDSLARVSFASTIKKADSALLSLSEVMDKVNSGEGSLGQLVNNDSLHNALVLAAQELEVLLDDMENNPDRYIHFSVFGKRDKNTFSKKEVEQMKKALKEEQ